MRRLPHSCASKRVLRDAFEWSLSTFVVSYASERSSSWGHVDRGFDSILNCSQQCTPSPGSLSRIDRIETSFSFVFSRIPPHPSFVTFVQIFRGSGRVSKAILTSSTNALRYVLTWLDCRCDYHGFLARIDVILFVFPLKFVSESHVFPSKKKSDSARTTNNW